MNIMACTFIREEHGVEEKGIIINEGNGPIIDSKGKIVKIPIWNFTSVPYDFCINYNIEE